MTTKQRHATKSRFAKWAAIVIAARQAEAAKIAHLEFLAWLGAI